MSTTVTYKGETLTTVNNTTKTLETKGTWLEDDIELTDVSGGGSTLITKNISANGTYNASSDSADGYSQVTVSVPASAVDTGTKQITANGNGQDVVGYAAVDVAVPNSYSAGDEGKVVDNGALVAQTAHADVTPTTSDQTIDTTTNNSIKVKGDANLIAGNIKKDVTIFNTTGTYEGGGGGYTAAEFAAGTVPSGQLDITGFTFGRGYAFNECSGITSVVGAPTSLNSKHNQFSGCSGITTVNVHLPNASGGTNFFQNCTNLTTAVLKVDGNDGITGAFNACSKLEVADVTEARIRTNTFYNNTKLGVVILRKSDAITALENTGAIATGTPFKSGGTGGTIYIPKALYDHLGDSGTYDYQAASNWSTVYGYGTITFAKIEGSQYENYYADGTPIT